MRPSAEKQSSQAWEPGCGEQRLAIALAARCSPWLGARSRLGPARLDALSPRRARRLAPAPARLALERVAAWMPRVSSPPWKTGVSCIRPSPRANSGQAPLCSPSHSPSPHEIETMEIRPRLQFDPPGAAPR